jgi:hypothetical protein
MVSWRCHDAVFNRRRIDQNTALQGKDGLSYKGKGSLKVSIPSLLLMSSFFDARILDLMTPFYPRSLVAMRRINSNVLRIFDAIEIWPGVYTL